MIVYGVSPAFVFSSYGTGFTVSQFCEALPRIKQLGFGAFQPEIFRPDAVDEWIKGGAQAVSKAAQDTGLQASQFVAHFLLEEFTSPTHLASNGGVDALKRVVECAKAFPGCGVVTVPIGPFKLDDGVVATPAAYEDLEKQITDKLQTFLEVVTGAGLKLALEVLIYSLVGNPDRFLRIADRIGSPDLGINLDTGHAWAAREPMELLPYKLQGRLFGLHLKDNDGAHNLPLAPGKGTIPWQAFLRNLRATGYQGSWDIEIGCEPDQVDAEYTDGLNYLKSLEVS